MLSRPSCPWALSWRRWPFLVALDLVGAPLAAGAPALALRSSFGLAASPSPWMRSQIRLAAVLALLKFFSGATPISNEATRHFTTRNGSIPRAGFHRLKGALAKPPAPLWYIISVKSSVMARAMAFLAA